MSQLPVSGTGWNSITPEVFQYRVNQRASGDYIWPLPEYDHGRPIYTSNVYQQVYTGVETWNTSGYDYSAYANLLVREPLEHNEPRYIVNYYDRNQSGPTPVAATPIAIAQYALSTGMIYVGGNSGNWGGIQTGVIPSGGYNAY